MEQLKFICPLCGGKLLAWTEYVAYKKEKILSNGKISRTKSNPKVECQTDNWGFECSKCKESWSCTTWGFGADNLSQELDRLFTEIIRINKRRV